MYSMETSYGSGFHFDTPPPVSLESDIQPGGIEGNLTDKTAGTISSADSNSMDSKSVALLHETAVSELSSSKVLTEVSSSATSGTSSQDKNKDVRSEEISSDEQMSSGTFSIEGGSPRFADLPPKLKPVVCWSEVDQDIQADPRRRMSEKLSLDTRSVSNASDLSDAEIPSSTPRSDLTSPTQESGNFIYGDKGERFTTGTVDIMTQSIYMYSDENDTEEECFQDNMLDSISQATDYLTSTVQQEGATSLNRNSKIVKADNVVEPEPEKDKNTKMVSSLSETTTSATMFDEKYAAAFSTSYYEAQEENIYEQQYQESYEEQLVKTSRSHSILTDTKPSKNTPESPKPSSSVQPGGQEASSKSSEESSEKDPIAGWGKPLALPSPVRPSTPSKQSKKGDDPSVDTNKVKVDLSEMLLNIYIKERKN